ncbi:RraA family protein [Anaerotruncus rubiinfantis]|uniref:RraA family protein n=1 Tax=Anaerotruncus rubiinfantis TaxID=1720200 RepID=UPI0008379EE2|nr:RraA family protein [Anaerotruncus rubiinfantis]
MPTPMMNLENYVSSLEARGDLKPLPISEDEMCERYEQLFTSAVNDVLREDGLLRQTLSNEILPLREHMKVCGPVFTIRSAPSMEVSMEMESRAEMLEAITPGSVVVWDTAKENFAAHWGEMMTKTTKKHGCRGAIVDGGVRDTDRVLQQDFPLFCRYRNSNGMLGRTRINAYQVPVTIDGVEIFPGDFAFGDIDGCIIIPRDRAYDVLLRAEAIQRNEEDISLWIDDGVTPTEIVERGGYF